VASTDATLFPVPLNVIGVPSPAATQLNSYDRPLSGARISLGYWSAVDSDLVDATSPLFRAAGWELTGFFLGRRGVGIREDGSPLLLRPFLDVNNGRQSGFLVAAPGIATGTVFGSADLGLWGLEANAWKTVFANPPGETVRFDVLGGFRYLNFDSQVNINSQTAYANTQTAPALVPFAGNQVFVMDTFRTRNEFYGAQVGISGSYIIPGIIASTNLKLGLGDTHERITIRGDQLRIIPGGGNVPSTVGLYASATNSGTFQRDRIALLPEANFKLAIPLGRRFTFFGGYTLMGWANVVRPGAQIDPGLDITRIPNFPTGGANPAGIARPVVPFKEDFLFVQGLNVGVIVVW
jgi:hypothetical protein